jgi:predicted porin
VQAGLILGTLVKKTILFAAAAFNVATVAHADELSNLQEESRQLRAQNETLTKRIADIERRQRRLEALPAKPAAVTLAAKPTVSVPADYAYKAKPKAVDDSLTWHGLTVYGLIDMGVTYENHGAPLNSLAGAPINYLISPNSNGRYFGVGPNALSSSYVGLKGNQEIADGLAAIFTLQSQFNPESGSLSNGLGSVAQNNGLALTQQNAFGDSSRNGQMFNVAAYAGLSSPAYGTLTYGRQSALTSDGVVAYDPMSSSSAFSVIGFQGATGGGGDTENRIYDNSFKYGVNVGPFRAAVETQIRSGSGAFVAPGNAFEGQIGADYLGLSVDAIFAHIEDAVSASPLGVGVVPTATNPGAGFVAGKISDNTSFMFLAKYTTGPVKLYGGYEHIDFANPRNPMAVGGLLPGGYTLGTVNNTNFTSDRILQVFWTGVKYAVRPDLDLTAAYYHEEQNSFRTGAINVGGTCSTSAFAQCKGQLDAISVLADYRFAKRFDAYAGVMWSLVANGLANGFLHRSAIDPTVGMRFQF